MLFRGISYLFILSLAIGANHAMAQKPKTIAAKKAPAGWSKGSFVESFDPSLVDLCSEKNKTLDHFTVKRDTYIYAPILKNAEIDTPLLNLNPEGIEFAFPVGTVEKGQRLAWVKRTEIVQSESTDDQEQSDEDVNTEIGSEYVNLPIGNLGQSINGNDFSLVVVCPDKQTVKNPNVFSYRNMDLLVDDNGNPVEFAINAFLIKTKAIRKDNCINRILHPRKKN